jgi:hypothetical protein
MAKSLLIVMTILLEASLLVFKTPAKSATFGPVANAFTIVSLGDSHGNGAGGDQTLNFAATISQVTGFHPDFILHEGDFEDDKAITSQLDSLVTILKKAGLFNLTFIIRSNHDDHVSGSAGLWESYFSTAPNIKTLPSGVMNYTAMDSSSTYLTYSFDFANARFIGVDVPDDVSVITSEQYAFIDQRLTEAESLGLVHDFIFFHIPEYCVESSHCTCTARNDALCTPASFINLINQHPIASATFHGHEHILAWVHDSTRISSLSHPYEEFFTSRSGSNYYNLNSDSLFPDRVDYAYPYL